MPKRVSIDQLKVGMYVVGLDVSWIKTPFLSNFLMIKEQRQIEQLRASGVREVEIEDGSRGGVSQAVLESAAGTDGSGTGDAPPETSFEDELSIARRTYQEAKRIIEQAMQDVRTGHEIRSEEIAGVVRDLADSILRNPDALVSLTRLKSFDEYTFFHSVNTAILALGLGNKRGLQHDELFHLGCGALLHDIGKMKVPLEILNKPARLETHEFEIMKRHALEGVEILQHTTGFSEAAIKPALEHHERVDGTGYPFQRTRDMISEFGLISSVVDIYDAVTSERVYHRAETPQRALQLLFGLARVGNLDPQLVEQFIRCVGVYPVGSCVLLQSGEIGIVRQPHPAQPLSPILLLVRDASQQRVAPPKVLDLAKVGDALRSIAHVVDPRRLQIDTNAYLDAVPT